MREESYRSAGDRVKAWADRRQAARDRCLQADEKHSKKMTEAFERKEVRTREWRVQMAEEARQKAEALAATRKAASGRFVDELKQRDAQLEEAQLRAERNRLRLEEAKMIDLEQRADRAEEKWRECACPSSLVPSPCAPQRTRTACALPCYSPCPPRPTTAPLPASAGCGTLSIEWSTNRSSAPPSSTPSVRRRHSEPRSASRGGGKLCKNGCVIMWCGASQGTLAHEGCSEGGGSERRCGRSPPRHVSKSCRPATGTGPPPAE